LSGTQQRGACTHIYRSPGTIPAKGAALSTELAKAEPAEAGNSEMSAGERLRIQSALL